MIAPVAGCDAPRCHADLVALIRGVGLCEEHLRQVSEVASMQDLDPAELSRAVIVALLQPASPAAERVAAKQAPLPKAKAPRAGFYWVRDEGDWTVIHVAADGKYRRMGYEGTFALAEHDFGRMVPISRPIGFPWEPGEKPTGTFRAKPPL